MGSRKLPGSLPALVYLLACDPERQKLTGTELAVVVRGAALADLNLRGCLVEDGRTLRASGTRRTGDRVLDGVLSEISEARPRGRRGCNTNFGLSAPAPFFDI